MDIQTFIDQYPLVIFIAGWLAVGYLVPRFTGWRKLSEAYRASVPFEGKWHRFQTGYMRWGTHYGNVLDVGVNAQGLYLSVFLLLRMGHPALFIPWSEIKSERVTAGFFPRVRLRFLRVPSIPLDVNPPLAEKMIKESFGAFAVH